MVKNDYERTENFYNLTNEQQKKLIFDSIQSYLNILLSSSSSLIFKNNYTMIGSTFLLSFFMVYRCWIFSEGITNLLLNVLPPKLTNFELVNYQSFNLMLVYGGWNDTYHSDKTFIMNLTTNNVYEVNSTIRPEIRINPSIIALNNSFFLTGGTKLIIGQDNQTVFTELWRLDLMTMQWELLKDNLQPFKTCQMFSNSNLQLAIVGASFNGVLNVVLFNVYTKSFSNLNISFMGMVELQIIQWDGSKQINQIRIQQSPPNFTKLITLSQFDTTYISTLLIIKSNKQKQFLMKTDFNIYQVSYNVSTGIFYIKFRQRLIEKYKKSYSQLVYSRKWNIFCTLQNDADFYLTFSNYYLSQKQNIYSNNPSYYSDVWPDFTGSSKLFSLILYQIPYIKKYLIILVVHKTLKVYFLFENVFDSFPFLPTTSAPGVANTFFGVNQCIAGWSGRNCTISACSNSLILKGSNNISVINFLCSGHGKCTTTGCVCDQHWKGPDCSIYKRKQCSGTLLTNFPLSNCECFNSTIGGNSCKVIFCPNDCTGNGKCNDGSCICDDLYYGADCSIMVVQFPM